MPSDAMSKASESRPHRTVQTTVTCLPKEMLLKSTLSASRAKMLIWRASWSASFRQMRCFGVSSTAVLVSTACNPRIRTNSDKATTGSTWPGVGRLPSVEQDRHSHLRCRRRSEKMDINFRCRRAQTDYKATG